jgi:hypothetical protein
MRAIESFMASRRIFILAGLSAACAGCVDWVAAPQEPSQLPPARMSPDSVGLEIAFVRLPLADTEADAAIWAEADEQHFPQDLRRQFIANGLRAGVLGQHLPTKLREALDQESTLDDRARDVNTSDGEVNRGQRRISCRPGRRAEIVVSKTHPSLALLTKTDTQVSGALLENARCLFAIKPYPQGDGRVKLDVTPEVEYGEATAQWVGHEGSFMQRVGRQRKVFDSLRLEAILQPGQVLLISTTADAKGLGQHFFLEEAAGRAERTLLLVRVSQTQWDDLFAPEQVSTPLATPVE